QATEEEVPVVRNWAAEEAQRIIEQMRGQPMASPPLGEPQALGQANLKPAGRATSPLSPAEIEDMEAMLVPGVFQVEAEQPQPRALTAYELEFQQTLILHTAQPPAQMIASEAAQEEPSREGHELVLAQAGTWHIGLFAEEVESVTEWRDPIPLPYAPPAILGVVSVRGRMLTVIDPATLLGERSSEKVKTTTPGFIIALRGDEQLALAVNRVDGHLGIYLSEIVASVGSANSNIMRGIIQGAHGQTIVLDARELFAAAMQGAERRRQRSQKQETESRIQNPE
ncbi:MAG: chemotaxis protein CheW, partial [Acidobacteria bacterium]|nr:chemotaxis protein CheW [Acidobacteriota bacterium]